MPDQPDVTDDRDRWCPSCQARRKWYEPVCPECGAALIDDPYAGPDPDLPLTPVFQITDGAILPLATMALEDAGIEYAIRSANVLIPGVRGGFGPDHTGFDKLVPGEILVRADDAVRARDLLVDLQQPPAVDPNLNEPTPSEWASTEPTAPKTDTE
jgi:hypothetical protein